MALTLRPELAYLGGRFLRGVSIAIEGGRIQSIATGGGAVPSESIELPRRAVVPGLVSAHSHAFQRLLRGATQWRAAGGDDFWAWRERMYEVVARLTPEGLEHVCALTFLEMLRAGITSVGEFHYLRRDPLGRGYANPNELALRVIAAAERVGIRIALLNSAYARGAACQPLAGAQVRFDIGSTDHFLRDTERLEREVKGRPLVSVAIAPHSVRALDRRQLEELGQAAARRGWPVHMHLAEQPREVEACLAETGRRPVELAAEAGLLTPGFCAVHAICVEPSEIELLGRAGATVCACPTTERDLGDGTVLADALRASGARLALGTDSNGQIDLLEEARSLELNLRLLRRERVLLEPTSDDRQLLARALFEAATTGGAAALGLRPAALEADASADLLGLDLDDPSLAGAEEDLLARLIFGGQTRAVSDVMVDGQFVIRDRHHPDERKILQQFAPIADSL